MVCSTASATAKWLWSPHRAGEALCPPLDHRVARVGDAIDRVAEAHDLLVLLEHAVALASGTGHHESIPFRTESSPPRSRVFGGIADATQEFLRVVVTPSEHRLADGDD